MENSFRTNTVKPVLRGHLWDKENWPYKTGGLLQEVQFIWNFLSQNKNRWPLKTGGCLIEVTTWAGLAVDGVRYVVSRH